MNDNPTIPQDATTALHRAFGGTHATVMTLLICVLVAALGGGPWMLVITVALAAAGQFIHSFTLVHGYLKAQDEDSDDHYLGKKIRVSEGSVDVNDEPYRERKIRPKKDTP